MRRLYFRLIVPDGPLRRFRLAEDFGEERRPDEGSALRRGAGVALAWCGLSAGCWLLAQGHLPGVSLEPLVAFANNPESQAWAVAIPGPDNSLFSVPAGRALNARAGSSGPHAAPASDVPVASNQAVHPVAAVRRDLPRVSYTVSVLHQGGEVGRDEQHSASKELAATAEGPSVEQPTSEDAPQARREFEPLSSQENLDVGAEQHEPPPAAREVLPRKSVAASYDPFEADFIAVKPSIPLPGREPAKAAVVEPESAFASKRETRTGASHVLHTGGGCQAAFDASNQVVNVAKSVAGSDATSEDYTAVLGRMNVLSCRPSGPLSVQVCVAVSERRAVGTTVTTSPGNAAVAGCIARQIAAMRFPASTGADLVRTRVDVE